VHNRTVANRHGLGDQERVGRSDQQPDLIRCENPFTFVKMDALTDLAFPIQCFGLLSIYSTQIEELAHEYQFKYRYRRSNKNHAVQQSFSQFGYQDILRIRLQTIEPLAKVKRGIMAEDRRIEMPAFSSYSMPRLVFKGSITNTSTLTALCATINMHYSDMMQEIICFTRQTAGDDRRLPADPTKLGYLAT